MSSQASSSKRQSDDPETHICQRCRQPLILDPTISNLTPSSHSLITSALPTPSQPSSLASTSKLKALPPSSKPGAEIWSSHNLNQNQNKGVADSFILLSDSVLPQQQHPSPQFGPLTGAALAQNLHDLLSSRTPISHPLCTECTAILQGDLQKELEELSRERDAYIEFQRGISRNREVLGDKRGDDEEGLGEYDIEGTEQEWQALMKRKKELEKEEERLKRILEDKEQALTKAREEEERVKREEEEIDKEEEDFLLEHAAQSTELKSLSNALQSAKTRLLLSQSLLSHLESTNVYNDAFQIGHVPLDPSSGRGSLMLGTINGLRLGGRPTVEWDEINAAWGLVALCIDRIAVKVGCVFEGYKIMPLGSFSRIEELPPNKGVYELYASSDLSPARLLQNRRFNHALVSLLDLLRQLVEFGREKDRGWGVGNIEIRKDRISGHSIRLPGLSAMQMPTLSSMSIMNLGGSSTQGAERDRDDSSGEEQWTRACRAVLAVLKRVLVVESEADRSVLGRSALGAQEGQTA